MVIPKRVIVQGVAHTVEEHKFNDDTNGMCVSELGRILIKKSLCEDKKKQTFLHELIHAIENSNNAIDELSEIQVEMLATGLHTFMRDNKKVIEWLTTK